MEIFFSMDNNDKLLLVPFLFILFTLIGIIVAAAIPAVIEMFG